MKYHRKHLWVMLVAVISACDTQNTQAVDLNDAAEISTFTIMTFNVENLFDNIDDPGKDDKAYLAIDAKQSDKHKAACADIEVPRWRGQCLNWDWSDDVIARKLAAIANAVLQVDDGRGPDILALQEVENINILERLRNEYLNEAGYLPGILIEGQDERGIDVAFLSRFKLAAQPTLHAISFAGDFPKRDTDTRGILQADFILPDGSVLTGYAVHFPAPYHPTAMRIAAYNQLNQLKAALPTGRPAFAAGDFNTTSAEVSKKNMLDRFVRPYWTVAHELGCGDCKGTSYYARDDSWSFLDMILWSSCQGCGAHATWVLRKNSARIANQTNEQELDNGTPARFSLVEDTGVSDHWPVVVTLELK